MNKFTAQAAWIADDGQDHEDVEDFNTEDEARAWLDNYHTGRDLREIWQGRRLVANLS